MRQVELTAGQRTQALSIFSDSLPQRIEFEISTPDNTEPVGVIDVETSMLPMMTVKRVSHPLKTVNRLEKSWLQSNLKIYVTSQSDAVLQFKTRHVTSRLLWIIIATVTVLGVAAALIPFLLR